MNQTYCMTVKDVYGVDVNELSAPEGYEFTGEFRPPVCGETVATHLGYGYGPTPYPRLILRKKEKTTLVDVYGRLSMQELMDAARKQKYELTGEFRIPEESEHFLTVTGEIGTAYKNFEGGKRLIAKSFEQAIIEIYGVGKGNLTPPKGYRFTGEFRPPTEKDVWLSRNREQTWGYRYSDPRLILEKIPPTPPIESIYGDKNVPIPSGWKFKEFREIKAWEKLYYLSCNGVVLYLSCEDLYFHDILESKVPFYRIVIEPDLSSFVYKTTVSDVYGSIPKVPEGYTVADFRIPKEGEPFLRTNEKVGYCPSFSSCEGPRLILRKD